MGPPIPPEGWEVIYVPLGAAGRDSLTELMDELTSKQQATLRGHLQRLETYGTALGRTYFEKVTGTPLSAWRGTVQDCEVRFLYRRQGSTFVMLVGFKKNKPKIPQRMIDRAIERWATWESNNAAE